MLARATGCRLVSLLTKDHVLGGEPPNLYEKLTGSRALNAAVKQPSFSTRTPLGLTRRRAGFCLAPFFNSAVIAPTFLGGQIEFVVFHLILHSE
jgi:hypothetical protein